MILQKLASHSAFWWFHIPSDFQLIPSMWLQMGQIQHISLWFCQIQVHLTRFGHYQIHGNLSKISNMTLSNSDIRDQSKMIGKCDSPKDFGQFNRFRAFRHFLTPARLTRRNREQTCRKNIATSFGHVSFLTVGVIALPQALGIQNKSQSILRVLGHHPTQNPEFRSQFPGYLPFALKRGRKQWKRRPNT